MTPTSTCRAPCSFRVLAHSERVGAGGEDVVKQEQPLPVEGGDAMKSATDVGVALVDGQFCLGRCRSRPLADLGQDRQVQQPAQVLA